MIDGSTAYGVWSVKFRKSKAGIVYYDIRTYAYTGGYNEIYVPIPQTIWTKISPATDIVSYQNIGYDVVFPTVQTNRNFIRQQWNDDLECFGINRESPGATLVITFKGGYSKMALGSYPIIW